MSRQYTADVAIVGAGPAGLAAALAVAKAGKRAILLDEDVSPGGQIWRASQSGLHPNAREAFSQIEQTNLQWISGATVFDRVAGEILAETTDGTATIRSKSVILATGASELFLPFPGWTLPNVVGVGAIQALSKSGLDVRGKRIVVAGTGPLLFAIAHHLEAKNAIVVAVIEQATRSSVFGFGLGLLRFPDKLKQALTMGGVASRAKYSRWVTRAIGTDRLEAVVLSDGSAIDCDYLACSYGLTPNIELAQIMGCRIDNGFVWVDENQETTVPGVYCAGEPTSIGGVDLSITEGTIAGTIAAGEMPSERSRQDKFKQFKFVGLFDRAFSLRDELRSLADDETIVCRCEDVRWGQLRSLTNSRQAKLQTRCGMGPCQGKICGPALRAMQGWEMGTVRPPMKPVSVQTLVEGYVSEEKQQL